MDKKATVEFYNNMAQCAALVAAARAVVELVEWQSTIPPRQEYIALRAALAPFEE